MSKSNGRRQDWERWILNPAISSLVHTKARKVSRLPGFSPSDQDDIEQELWVQLLRKSSLYDPARASPETFASRILDNRAASIIRAVQAQKRAATNVVRLDDSLDDQGGRPTVLAALVEDSEARRHAGVGFDRNPRNPDLRMDIRELTADAPPILRKFMALLCHVPQFTAAQILGLTRRQAAAMVEELRILFTSAGFEPEVQSPRHSRM